jgi:hypothetical protein
MPHALSYAEFLAVLRKSFALPTRYPLRWLALTILFLIAVEATSLVPYVGLFIKITLASLMVRQWMQLLADVDAGRLPRLCRLFGGFNRPFSELWPLLAAGLIPLAFGIAFLLLAGRGRDVAFLFGALGESSPPDYGRFVMFKAVMYTVALPLVFVATGIAVYNQRGLVVIYESIVVASRNWLVMVFVLFIEIAFELVQWQLSVQAPRHLAVMALIASSILFFAWTLSFSYALSVAAYGTRFVRKAAYVAAKHRATSQSSPTVDSQAP